MKDNVITIEENGNFLTYIVYKDFIHITNLFVKPENRGKHWFKNKLDDLISNYKRAISLECNFELISYYKHLGFIYDGSAGNGLYGMLYDPLKTIL